LGEIGDPNSPLGLLDFASGYVAGNKRINDDAAFPTRFQSQKFRNTILLATLTSQHTADSIETTWRVLAEVETARGRLIMKIPTFDANVQKLLVACGKQYENAKNPWWALGRTYVHTIRMVFGAPVILANPIKQEAHDTTARFNCLTKLSRPKNKCTLWPLRGSMRS
jgi:hypothetical protein